MDYEKTILVYCLKNIKVIELILFKGLSKDQFSNFECQKLFESIVYIYKKYKCILNDIMLKQVLEKSSLKNTSDQKRIILLFTELANSNLPDTPAEFILDQIIEKYKSEKFDESIKSAALLRRDKETDKAIELMKKNIYGLSNFTNEERLDEGFIGDDAQDKILEYDNKKNNPLAYVGLSTGYPRFDEETGGLQKGQVIVVMGAAKSAKSVFVLNVAHNIIKQGKRVLLVVNEGGKSLPEKRYFSLNSGVNYTKLRDSKLSQEEEDRFKKSVIELSNSKLLKICSIPPSRCTSSLIGLKLEEMETEVNGKVDLLIVDYLGNMDVDNPNSKREDDWKKLGSIALELKSLAMIKRIPILTPFHVTREAGKKKGGFYTQFDIGRSIEIGKTVDMLISWKVENQEEFDLLHSGAVKMKIAASRDSAPAMIEMFADLNVMQIIEKPSGFSVKENLNTPVGV